MTQSIKQREDTDAVESIANCLLNGGVVLLPTDTVYGLAVMPTFEKSIERLYDLKQRPGKVNLPIMVDSAERLKDIGFAVSDEAQRLFKSPLVPGSLTIVMGFKSAGVPDWLQGREEAAVRIPDDENLLAVLKIVGPLLVTSANLHGSETPENLADVLAQLNGAPELAVDGGILQTVPSTLVNCNVSPPVVERVGVIPEAEVLEYLK